MQSCLGLQGGLAEVEEVLSTSIDGSRAKGTKVLLVLDGVDFLLAAPQINVDEVLDVIEELREVCCPSHGQVFGTGNVCGTC